MVYVKLFQTEQEKQACTDTYEYLSYTVESNKANIHKDYSKEYLTFIALEDGTFNFSGASTAQTISYSTDNGKTWSTPSNNITINVNSDDKVLWKGEINPVKDVGIGVFSASTASFDVEGNIMSLLYGDNYQNHQNLSDKDSAFRNLWNGAKVVHSHNLSLQATTLSNNCYRSLFNNCSSLITAPQLIATTIPLGAYSFMFRGSSITQAPQLIATTLAASAYTYMFYGCKSLTTAPELLATTLPNNCYAYMFSGCTSLTTAPELPATTLATYCYSYMFAGCTSLTQAPQLPATTLANSCYLYMFYNCKKLAQVPSLSATTLAVSACTNMFNGCTSLVTAPQLPATTLANSCYQSMFANCYNLTTAPSLPATTLAENCYNGMLALTNALPDCSNIDFTSTSVVNSGGLRGLFANTKVTDNDLMNILPINPQTNHYYLPVTSLTKTHCYSDMFVYCHSLTTAPELPATTLASSCYYRMFASCTSLTTAPELPATTLAASAYTIMFSNCTSLTTAPELLATTLTNYCYQGMFSNCTKLNYIKMLATDISASNCLTNWVNNVASNGTFVKASSMTTLPSGASGIPNGWTVQDA